MKFKILIIMFGMFIFPNFVSAEVCSNNGYTVITINGMVTTTDGAIYNSKEIMKNVPTILNNETVFVDYIENESHLAGIGDFADSANQKSFEGLTLQGYDLTNMLNDLSRKVKTKKILFVAHSQGNFYSNDIYNLIASKSGGVPKESLGLYGIGSPTSYIAGGGKHITSKNDKIINLVRLKGFLNVLESNVNITGEVGDDPQGHNLSTIYLKHQGSRISSEIKSSLNKLKNNDIQNSEEVCISAPKITALHKTVGYFYTVADPAALVVKTGLDGTYDVGYYVVNKFKNISLAIGKTFKGLLANAIGTLSDINIITTTDDTPNPTSVAADEIKIETTPDIQIADEPIVDPVSETVNPTEPTIIEPVIIIDEVPKPQGGGGGESPEVIIETEKDPEPIPEILVDETAPVITITGNSIDIILKNSTYIDAGAIALDDKDESVDVVATGINEVDTTTIGTYTITYTATDKAGNISTKNRTVKVATYKYISKYSFGRDNDDGKNWQVWSFEGSNIYDWSDTYVDNYLREQFKIQSYSGKWCSQCLQRGIFDGDPKNGFEFSNLIVSNLENNPQNNQNNTTYDVSIQWDETGYTYTISHDNIIDSSGHTDILNIDENTWVGWNGSQNNFQTFPSGQWLGVVFNSPFNREGGSGMITKPFPVYQNESIINSSALSIPNKGIYTVGGISPTQGRENLTPFSFKIDYTDESNNAPQDVNLHITNSTSEIIIPKIEMNKILSTGSDIYSDGSFVNSESYITENILFDSGEYEYYFTANNNTIRIPEVGNFIFKVIPSTYKYITKYSFGTNNEDNNNWQIWSFEGSNIYDWSDTYVDNYLREQFKIQAISGKWCSQCLGRGVFNRNPKKGFELSDLKLSNLENNPQNNQNNIIYDVIIQWDETGYTYTISHDNIIDSTDHTDILNIDENTWVGWNGSQNNFQTFPSGEWRGIISSSPQGLSGGSNMILEPYPVYVYSGPVLDKSKIIHSFNLDPNIIGTIDQINHTIILTVPFGTDITALTPKITFSNKASIVPNNNTVQNFTNPITYTITAENNSSESYVVSVVISPNPNPEPEPEPEPDPTPDPVESDTTPPIILKLTLSPSPIRGYAKIGDTITLTILSDDVGYLLNKININGVSAINFKDNGDNSYSATYTVSAEDDDIFVNTIPVSVILSDKSGNKNLAFTTVKDNALMIDANYPKLVSAKVVTPNTIEVTFNEDIDGATLNTSGNEFTVSGYTITEARELEGVITLTLSTTVGSDNTILLTFNSTNFKDLAGNQAVNGTLPVIN